KPPRRGRRRIPFRNEGSGWGAHQHRHLLGWRRPGRLRGRAPLHGRTPPVRPSPGGFPGAAVQAGRSAGQHRRLAPDGAAGSLQARRRRPPGHRLLRDGQAPGHRPLLPVLPGCAADPSGLRLPEGLPAGTAGARHARAPDPGRHQRNHAPDRGAPHPHPGGRPAMSATAMTESAGQDPVLFREIPANGGRLIGVATLNSPKTLNGLSLPMCRLLDARLRAWAADERLVAIMLKGTGGKAFCAGGDLHALYRAMLDSPAGDPWANVPAREFFETEYRLDHLIHRYPKPVLCWADGIVMGGGVGLMLGASHRIVTGATRFAMPEVTIGLYPD